MGEPKAFILQGHLQEVMRCFRFYFLQMKLRKQCLGLIIKMTKVLMIRNNKKFSVSF